MAIEKERKFLLNENSELPDLPGRLIHQGYLMLENRDQLRVRLVNNKEAFITFKRCVSDTKRFEFEYDIPYEDGLELFKLAQYKLSKKRISFDGGKYHIDIDMYPSGLKIIEIEYSEEVERLPKYCGEEITGRKEYSNIQLAKNGNEIWT